MKILYATGLSPNDTSLYRLWALERLGHQVIPFNVFDYESRNPVLRKVNQRLVIGPSVTRLNTDLIKIAEAEKPDVLWTDKLLYIRPRTLDRMRVMSIATVSYMIDNPFGTRQDPGWRMYMKDIPHYDLHVVQRDQNILDYKSRGARDVIKIQTAYEPTLQFPPPEGWSDADRNREVSFIGTPTTTAPKPSRGSGATAAFPSSSPATPASGAAPWSPAPTKPSSTAANSFATSTAKASGDPKSTSASSPTPTATSSCTRASRSPVAEASCSPSAPTATCSASKKTRRRYSSPDSKS
ncbi:hypothetical protein RBB78_18010 [Tunturiibacter empetritectus]